MKESIGGVDLHLPSQGTDDLENEGPVPASRTFGHDSPEDALRAVGEWSSFWNQKLSDWSVQLSYALVAANWAVFGNKNALLASPWAQISLGLVIMFFVTNLLLTRIIGELLVRRYAYGETDQNRWRQEYDRSSAMEAWPSTPTINRTARVLREARTWLPLTSGLMFLLAVL